MEDIVMWEKLGIVELLIPKVIKLFYNMGIEMKIEDIISKSISIEMSNFFNGKIKVKEMSDNIYEYLEYIALIIIHRRNLDRNDKEVILSQLVDELFSQKLIPAFMRI